MRFTWLLLPWLLLTACGENTQDEDTTPPVSPAFAVKSADTTQTESGIDAAPNGIQLEWTFVDDPADDLEGVRIYRSEHPDSTFLPLEEFGAPRLVPANLTWYIDNDAEVLPQEETGPRRFYYYLRAIDTSGNLSEASDSASYRLWYPPENLGFTLAESTYNCHIELYSQDLSIDGLLLKFSDGHFYRCLPLMDDLTQVIDYTLAVEELPQPVHPDSLRLRVDIIVPDEIETDTPSNPGGYNLSGSESDWIGLISL